MPYRDIYDRNGKKLDGKYCNIVSSLTNNPIYNKNSNKLDGIYRKVNQEYPEEYTTDENPLP
jgi:hypothetical protein